MPARPYATSIVKKLVDAGYVTYFNGGWVRDLLMNRPSDDIDIATSATVDEIQKLFPKTIPVGVAFGIVIVVEGSFQFEVATFRKDRGYVDGRRPIGIDPATPEEDAQRRDFTINGMFYDPLTDQLYDYVGGREDIKKGIIRAIGNPHERFREDRLRMMRAVRYSTRFDFSIESNTLNAIVSHANDLMPAVAIERIWQEFKKMSQFAHFDSGLITLHQLQLLPQIFPVLKAVSTEEIQHRVRFIERFPKQTPTLIELLELFPEFDLQQILNLCEQLKLANQEKITVKFYHHAKNLLSMPKAWLENMERIEWAEFYAHPLSELCLQIFACRLPSAAKELFLKEHQIRKQQLAKSIERIASKNPLIKAEDLIKEGISPGQHMGQLLKEAQRISVNKNLEDPAQVIEYLKKTPSWKITK